MNPEQAIQLKDKMSPESKEVVAKLLDKQLEEELAKVESRSGKYMDGWSEDNWEQEMLEHPFFATQDSMLTEELSPLMKGLQDLKYSEDENSPLELGNNYKEDGNFNFKCKKYRLAIVAYSEGIRNLDQNKDQRDDEQVSQLRATLLANRSAAQFFLGNFRSSLIDCRLALAVSPHHWKALKRAVQCCMELKRYEEALGWCDHGLDRLEESSSSENRKQLEEAALKAQRLQGLVERDKRRDLAARKKQRKEDERLLNHIKAKGIQIEIISDSELGGEERCWNVDDLEPISPAVVVERVHLDPTNGCLVWPVIFMYPEFGQTETILDFAEDQQTFADHLNVMFGDPKNPPGWDSENRYKPSTINIYFEEKVTKRGQPTLVPVPTCWTLDQVLTDSRHRVRGGMPSFILLLRESAFEKEFIKKYI